MTQFDPYDLKNGLGYRLTLASRKNQQFFDGLLSDLAITRQMWAILIMVGTNNVTLPGEIAASIGVNRTSVSRSLRQMEKLGLLRREDGKNDKRTTRVFLTERGADVLARSLPMAQMAQDNLRQHLTEAEQQQFSDLLDKILAGNDGAVTGL